jgi:hypothetical protein
LSSLSRLAYTVDDSQRAAGAVPLTSYRFGRSSRILCGVAIVFKGPIRKVTNVE